MNFLTPEILINFGLVLVERRTVSQETYVSPVMDVRGATVKHRQEYTAWINMLDRCYNKNSKAYKYYGDKGVFVSLRWLTFSKFFEDLKNLPNYDLYLMTPRQYAIDKDYYGSNCYSRETTIWLSQSSNTVYAHSVGLVLIQPLFEKPFLTINLTSAAKTLGENPSQFSKALMRKKPTSHGTRVILLDRKNLYRYLNDKE